MLSLRSGWSAASPRTLSHTWSRHTLAKTTLAAFTPAAAVHSLSKPVLTPGLKQSGVRPSRQRLTQPLQHSCLLLTPARSLATEANSSDKPASKPKLVRKDAVSQQLAAAKALAEERRRSGHSSSRSSAPHDSTRTSASQLVVGWTFPAHFDPRFEPPPLNSFTRNPHFRFDLFDPSQAGRGLVTEAELHTPLDETALRLWHQRYQYWISSRPAKNQTRVQQRKEYVEKGYPTRLTHSEAELNKFIRTDEFHSWLESASSAALPPVQFDPMLEPSAMFPYDPKSAPGEYHPSFEPVAPELWNEYGITARDSEEYARWFHSWLAANPAVARQREVYQRLVQKYVGPIWRSRMHAETERIVTNEKIRRQMIDAHELEAREQAVALPTLEQIDAGVFDKEFTAYETFAPEMESLQEDPEVRREMYEEGEEEYIEQVQQRRKELRKLTKMTVEEQRAYRKAMLESLTPQDYHVNYVALEPSVEKEINPDPFALHPDAHQPDAELRVGKARWELQYGEVSERAVSQAFQRVTRALDRAAYLGRKNAKASVKAQIAASTLQPTDADRAAAEKEMQSELSLLQSMPQQIYHHVAHNAIASWHDEVAWRIENPDLNELDFPDMSPIDVAEKVSSFSEGTMDLEIQREHWRERDDGIGSKPTAWLVQQLSDHLFYRRQELREEKMRMQQTFSTRAPSPYRTLDNVYYSIVQRPGVDMSEEELQERVAQLKDCIENNQPVPRALLTGEDLSQKVLPATTDAAAGEDLAADVEHELREIFTIVQGRQAGNPVMPPAAKAAPADASVQERELTQEEIWEAEHSVNSLVQQEMDLERRYILQEDVPGSEQEARDEYEERAIWSADRWATIRGRDFKQAERDALKAGEEKQAEYQRHVELQRAWLAKTPEEQQAEARSVVQKVHPTIKDEAHIARFVSDYIAFREAPWNPMFPRLDTHEMSRKELLDYVGSYLQAMEPKMAQLHAKPMQARLKFLRVQARLSPEFRAKEQLYKRAVDEQMESFIQQEVRKADIASLTARAKLVAQRHMLNKLTPEQEKEKKEHDAAVSQWQELPVEEQEAAARAATEKRLSDLLTRWDSTGKAEALKLLQEADADLHDDFWLPSDPKVPEDVPMTEEERDSLQKMVAAQKEQEHRRFLNAVIGKMQEKKMFPEEQAVAIAGEDKAPTTKGSPLLADPFFAGEEEKQLEHLRSKPAAELQELVRTRLIARYKRDRDSSYAVKLVQSKREETAAAFQARVEDVINAIEKAEEPNVMQALLLGIDADPKMARQTLLLAPGSEYWARIPLRVLAPEARELAESDPQEFARHLCHHLYAEQEIAEAERLRNTMPDVISKSQEEHFAQYYDPKNGREIKPFFTYKEAHSYFWDGKPLGALEREEMDLDDDVEDEIEDDAEVAELERRIALQGGSQEDPSLAEMAREYLKTESDEVQAVEQQERAYEHRGVDPSESLADSEWEPADLENIEYESDKVVELIDQYQLEDTPQTALEPPTVPEKDVLLALQTGNTDIDVEDDPIAPEDDPDVKLAESKEWYADWARQNPELAAWEKQLRDEVEIEMAGGRQDYVASWPVSQQAVDFHQSLNPKGGDWIASALTFKVLEPVPFDPEVRDQLLHGEDKDLSEEDTGLVNMMRLNNWDWLDVEWQMLLQERKNSPLYDPVMAEEVEKKYYVDPDLEPWVADELLPNPHVQPPQLVTDEKGHKHYLIHDESQLYQPFRTEVHLPFLERPAGSLAEKHALHHFEIRRRPADEIERDVSLIRMQLDGQTMENHLEPSGRVAAVMREMAAWKRRQLEPKKEEVDKLAQQLREANAAKFPAVPEPTPAPTSSEPIPVTHKQPIPFSPSAPAPKLEREDTRSLLETPSAQLTVANATAELQSLVTDPMITADEQPLVLVQANEIDEDVLYEMIMRQVEEYEILGFDKFGRLLTPQQIDHTPLPLLKKALARVGYLPNPYSDPVAWSTRTLAAGSNDLFNRDAMIDLYRRYFSMDRYEKQIRRRVALLDDRGRPFKRTTATPSQMRFMARRMLDKEEEVEMLESLSAEELEMWKSYTTDEGIIQWIANGGLFKTQAEWMSSAQNQGRLTEAQLEGSMADLPLQSNMPNAISFEENDEQILGPETALLQRQFEDLKLLEMNPHLYVDYFTADGQFTAEGKKHIEGVLLQLDNPSKRVAYLKALLEWKKIVGGDIKDQDGWTVQKWIQDQQKEADRARAKRLAKREARLNAQAKEADVDKDDADEDEEEEKSVARDEDDDFEPLYAPDGVTPLAEDIFDRQDPVTGKRVLMRFNARGDYVPLSQEELDALPKAKVLSFDQELAKAEKSTEKVKRLASGNAESEEVEVEEEGEEEEEPGAASTSTDPDEASPKEGDAPHPMLSTWARPSTLRHVKELPHMDPARYNEFQAMLFLKQKMYKMLAEHFPAGGITLKLNQPQLYYPDRKFRQHYGGADPNLSMALSGGHSGLQLLQVIFLMRKYRNASILAEHVAREMGVAKSHSGLLRTLENVVKWMETIPGLDTGLQIKVSGRINGAARSRHYVIKSGNIPVQTIHANIDYALAHAHARIGVFGVKVWLFQRKLDRKEMQAPALARKGTKSKTI